MTEVYNNQIACLIVKNRNLPQRRQYHYTNSLLLPTDNQLLGMIANPDILNPNTPDEPDTKTSGDLGAEASNKRNKRQAAEDAEDAEMEKTSKAGRKITKVVKSKLDRNKAMDEVAKMKKRIEESQAAILTKAVQVDKKALRAYSAANQGKKDMVRVHPSGGVIGKKERGEDHPVTLEKRKRVSGNINQRKRDHEDHDAIMRNGWVDNRDPNTHSLPEDTREAAKLNPNYERSKARKTRKERKESNDGAAAGAAAGGISTGGRRRR